MLSLVFVQLFVNEIAKFPALLFCDFLKFQDCMILITD